MLAREEIVKMYGDLNLRPAMVVLGGSRAFNYDMDSSDLDYFGYHLDHEMPNEDCSIKEIVHVGDINGIYINSRPISSVAGLLASDEAYAVVYTLIGWLCIKPIYETTHSESCRNNVVLPFFKSNKEKVLKCFEMLIEDLNNISIDESGEYDKRFNKWKQTLHITLVAHHLRKTGEIICNLENLVSIYNVDVKRVQSLKSLLTHL